MSTTTSTHRIEGDLQHERDQLGRDLDALQGMFSPHHMVEEALAYIQTTDGRQAFEPG